MTEHFYVTVIKDDETRKVGYLLGPYDNHREALDNVPRARNLAYDADPRSHWYFFGTTKVTPENPNKVMPEGVFGK